MRETKQLLEAFTALEAEMQKFSGLANQVVDYIGKKEFVPEMVNTDMMQCIIELNRKEKECFSLYSKLRPGEKPPAQLQEMKKQIDAWILQEKKGAYLDAVKKSFHSLYTEDAEVERILGEFKDKMDVIRPDKYPIDQCMVYIRPFAVFLSMIKEENPVKSFEQVPVLVEYFGSELVAHITVVKDIHLGDSAVPFRLDDTNSASESGHAETANTPSGEIEPAQQKMDAPGAMPGNGGSQNTDAVPKGKGDALRTEAAPTAEASGKTAVKTEAKQKKAKQKEAEKKEAEKKEAEKKEAERKEAERKEAERKEAERKEAEKGKTVVEASAKPDAAEAVSENTEEEAKSSDEGQKPEEKVMRIRNLDEIKRASAKKDAARKKAEERIERLERLEEDRRLREETRRLTEKHGLLQDEPEIYLKEEEPEVDFNSLSEEEKRQRKLKAVLEQENFSESKVQDAELQRMERTANKGAFSFRKK